MTTFDSMPPCCIAPPDLLEAVAEQGTPEEREAALRTLSTSESSRAQRASVTGALRQLAFTIADVAPAPGMVRTVYDAEHGGDFDLPGKRRRGEGDPPFGDAAVDDAYDGAGATYDFYRTVFERDSIDGRGLEIVSSVHYGNDYDNAAWIGFQMIYGDGSGQDLHQGVPHQGRRRHRPRADPRHHPVHREPGLQQAARRAQRVVLRRLRLPRQAVRPGADRGAGRLADRRRHPGQRPAGDGPAVDEGAGDRLVDAHRRPDRQPAHMRDYVDLPDDGNPSNDHGGVHINSGIPNHAFYLAATAIGGNAWERAGRIWYVTLTERLRPRSDFRQAAEATVQVAGELFGADGDEQRKVRAAWQQVGVL